MEGLAATQVITDKQQLRDYMGHLGLQLTRQVDKYIFDLYSRGYP
jgi:hypothetical protein